MSEASRRAGPESQSARPVHSYFLRYLAAHSFLIGLVPFFIPVWLWQGGMRLDGLSLLIGCSGIAFCLALRTWHRVALKHALSHLVVASFLLEIALVSLALLADGPLPDASGFWLPALIGIANGVYNAWFWTTQRVLFLGGLGHNEAGKRFGNLQIIVAIFLKSGILIGGLLLDLGGLAWLFVVSVGVAVVGAGMLRRGIGRETILVRLGPIGETPTPDILPMRRALGFRDSIGSRPVFLIDGVFLYLESHFWTVSLFLLVGQDFSRLGLVVVVLAVVFSTLFWLLKNRIDRIEGHRLYTTVTLLYALSWLLRAAAEPGLSNSAIMILLVIITFFTSLFRLSFNKRFYDQALRVNGLDYILIKSYLSQCSLGMTFLALTLALFLLPTSSEVALTMSYLAAALLAFGYLLYRPATLPKPPRLDDSDPDADATHLRT